MRILILFDEIALIVKTVVKMESTFRWKTYGNYKLFLWAWMMNEVTLVFSPMEMSHNGFYIQCALFFASAVFIGIPLLYSEICIAQYTNCHTISMWNFFPIMRCVGYGKVLLVFYKVIYLIVLSSWYLNYTFHAALDPPPWFTCDDVNDTKCMVKRVNTSIFQHCIETQILFNDDCGMKTASFCFFEVSIDDNNTRESNCIFQWKSVIIGSVISLVLFIFFLKKEKFFRIVTKISAAYICFVIFVLFCVALSASGAWYASGMNFNLRNIDLKSCTLTSCHGVLSLGAGYGMAGFLSREVPFRSPATMTSITVSLFSVLLSIVLSLIIFSGIKSMSFFHGEEANILEIGDHVFFPMFASVTEITSYYDERSIWSFLWFSGIFLCLFTNLCISLYYLHDLLVTNFMFANRYYGCCCALLIVTSFLISCPMFCSDLVASFSDATEIIQLVNCTFFSISVYWIYGYNNHKVDILFMIGVKSSYFWKVAWCGSPILLIGLIYLRSQYMNVQVFKNSYEIESIGITCDLLLTYILLSLYVFTIAVGLVYECWNINTLSRLQSLFYPTKTWGPQDRVLLRSRKMFVPEIMTREFLYRQVRIHGYFKDNVAKNTEDLSDKSGSITTEKIEWSPLTSN